MYCPKLAFSSLVTTLNLLKLNFSPILEVFAIIKSFKVPSSVVNFNAPSTSSSSKSLLIIAFAITSTNDLNSSFLATKSVSEFTSTITALFPFVKIAAVPSDFLAAFEIPFSLNQSIASSIFPLVASKAFLQSSIPAPDLSLNSFTKLALIMFSSLIYSIYFKASNNSAFFIVE